MSRSLKDNMVVGLAGPFPPPYGGMTVLSGTLKKSLELNGIRVIPIETNAKIFDFDCCPVIAKLFQYPIFLFELFKIFKVDILLIISSSGNFLYLKSLPMLILGKLFKRPVILDFVGGGVVDKLKNKNQILVKTLRLFDLVLVPTKTFQTTLTDVGIDCKLFPHIVEIERFSSSELSGLKLRILAVKALEKYSNVESILKAYAKVKHKYPEAELDIVGDGEQKKELERIVNQEGLSGVSFLGNVRYEDIPMIFNKATIFVHATKYESFGLVLVEALASGTPVVSTNVGGIPDIIENGRNGILVEFDDHQAMTQGILKISEEKDFCDTIKKNGIETAKKYSAAQLTPELMKILSNELR